jgi:hypothetical protein
MADQAADSTERVTHWESVYDRNQSDAVSWYQAEPIVSLELLESLGISADAGVIDVGGGASVLVDELLRRGFVDLNVLDISAAALQASRERVGDDTRVNWIAHDLLTWRPTRRYDLWHDRAVFHFLSGDEVQIYRDLVLRAVIPGGYVVMATFAPDGPERCSGLPVTRYDADQLIEMLGNGFELVDQRHEAHTTPSGAIQPFTWIVARRTID